MNSWAVSKQVFGFNGPNGMMYLNQLVNDGDAAEAVAVLIPALAVPQSDDEAAAAIKSLVSYTEKLREGGSAAAVGRAAFLLSWFWWLQDSVRWPALWPSAENALISLKFVGGSYPSTAQAERYLTFRDECAEFGPWPVVEQVLAWFHDHQEAVGLDPTGPARCASVFDHPREPTDGDPALYNSSKAAISVVLADVDRVGRALRDDVALALGRSVKVSTPSEYWVPERKRLRGDAWVAWTPDSGGRPTGALVLVVEPGRVLVALNPYLRKNGKGFTARAVAAVEASLPTGIDQLTWSWTSRDDLPPTPSRMLFGREVPIDAATSINELRQQVVSIAQELRPVFAAIEELSDVPTDPLAQQGTSEAPVPAPGDSASFDITTLEELVAQFKAERGYPNADDDTNERERSRYAAMLSSAHLATLDFAELRKLINGKVYGNPGPQSILNATLRDASTAELDRFLQTVHYLLWDEVEPIEARINRVLDDADLGFRGFKDSVIMKLLAVCQPERFLPVFPFGGPNGKAAALAQLGLPVPPLTLPAGERHVQANDVLRGILDPVLPEDAWIQSRFLYWLLDRSGLSSDDGDAVDMPSLDDPIDAAAKSLLLDRSFLDEIVSLLNETKQVIFYGPPGTGKTFVAQELAEAIAGDPSRHMLVQFHPSTSYEDFFEGYRPENRADGSLGYVLQDGPLRLIAQDAAADSDNTYVLVIDEINRAQLQKVLGELFFLLEYRDREVRPLYRPSESFQLPENLWIIGTMNTADRSIALIDSALRRRFQFVPFVPDEADGNPLAGLLSRWLETNGQPDWIATFVDGVNQRLKSELQGSHLVLGPSYFMIKEGTLDEERLRRIWKYRITPLIDDVFFGQPDRATKFDFATMWSAYGPGNGAIDELAAQDAEADAPATVAPAATPGA